LHGLDLIAANSGLIRGGITLANRQKTEEFSFLPGAETRIATVSAHYDVIIIDTPSSPFVLTTNALYAADGMVVPVPPR